MELQLPGPRIGESRSTRRKPTYPNGRPPCPFIYEYIYESGGGANWTPLHEFSCVPWFRQSLLLVILRAKSQLRKYERTEIRILVSVVYCTRFQWQLGQGNLIVLYRKHHSNQIERERDREKATYRPRVLNSPFVLIFSDQTQQSGKEPGFFWNSQYLCFILNVCVCNYIYIYTLLLTCFKLSSSTFVSLILISWYSFLWIWRNLQF